MAASSGGQARGADAADRREPRSKGATPAKDMSGQYRFTDTFIKRDGRWQAVATFSTKLK